MTALEQVRPGAVAATRAAERLIRAAQLKGINPAMTRPSDDVVRVIAIAANGDRLTVEFTESRNNPSGRDTCTQRAFVSSGTGDLPIKASSVMTWVFNHQKGGE